MAVWMAANKLCLNDAKTEFLTLCAPWQRSSVEVSSLGMGLLQVNAVPAGRNLGVIMDSALNMEAHIQRLCQTSVAQLKNIADIRRFITQNSVEKLVHAFITSRLDYCNALFNCTACLRHHCRSSSVCRTWQPEYSLGPIGMSTLRPCSTSCIGCQCSTACCTRSHC